MMGHGLAQFFRESSMNKSDETGAWFDRGGDLISYNEKTGRFVGIRDENDTVFAKHKIPFAFNVLKHEAEAIGVGMAVLADPPPAVPGRETETETENVGGQK